MNRDPLMFDVGELLYRRTNDGGKLLGIVVERYLHLFDLLLIDENDRIALTTNHYGSRVHSAWRSLTDLLDDEDVSESAAAELKCSKIEVDRVAASAEAKIRIDEFRRTCREEAHEQLEMQLPMVMSELWKFVDPSKPCDSLKLKAIALWLDKAGFNQLNSFNGGTEIPLENMTEDEIKSMITDAYKSFQPKN